MLPGCLLVALTITVMHAVSELYLPDRLDHASQLYGAFGTTVVTLGWFFILGRAIVIAMEVNAAIYDRYGSISQAAFPGPCSGAWLAARPGSAGFRPYGRI